MLVLVILCAVAMQLASCNKPWWNQNQDWDGGLWQTYYHQNQAADEPQPSTFWFPTFLKSIFAPKPSSSENEVVSNDIEQKSASNEVFIEHFNISDRMTEFECKGDQDCHKINVTLSCIGATRTSMGVCMLPLKPMEHGCVFNDQCKKTCVESFCAKEHKYKNSKGENQCRCQKGYYYLWKKCWNNCLPGTSPLQLHDDHWICQERNASEARLYMHRNKRQAYRRLVC